MTEPRKIDPKSATKPTETTPIYIERSELGTIPETKERMLNTHEAPENMPQKRRKIGRPSKYKPIYCEQLISFFNREHTFEGSITHTNKKGDTWTSYQTKANPVPLLVDFAQWLGVGTTTLQRWEQQHDAFRVAITHAQDLQLAHLSTVAGMGLYNSNWAVFMAKNISKWRDKKDIEHSGDIGISGLIEGLAGKAEQARQERSRIANHN